MSEPEAIPPDVMREAMVIAERNMFSSLLMDQAEAIARALLSAESRGRDKQKEADAVLADEEANAMLAQRDEIIRDGKIGRMKIATIEARASLSRERRVLAEGFQSLSDAIRNS